MSRGYSPTEVKIGWMHYCFLWYTRNAKPVLGGYSSDLCKLLIESKLKQMRCELKEIDIHDNHIFLGLKADPRLSPHFIISQLKSYTYKKLKDHPAFMNLPSLWSRSYFVSTFGRMAKKEMRDYDKFMLYRQKKHKKYVKKMNKLAREKRINNPKIIE